MKHIARGLAAVVALTMVVTLTACGSDDNKKDAAGPAGGATADPVAAVEKDPAYGELLSVSEKSTTYVGTVEGTDAYIAIVDNGAGTITAYVCDGSKIGAWAKGKRTGDTVSASGASGITIDATINGSTATGKVLLPSGTTKSFRASRAVHPAGLWQPYDTKTGKFAGLKVGWIVLEDGSQRGLALTSQKQLNTVDPVQVVGGPAGNSTPSGPVTTGGELTSECSTLLNLYNRGFRTFALNEEGSKLSNDGLKLVKQVEGLWSQQGCPGTPSTH